MVALPPSLLPRSASTASKKSSTKWSSKKWIQSLLLAVLTVSSILGTSVYTAPKAQAAQSSFATVFEDCSDTASESTWPEIKTCLQGVTMDAKYQTVWANVIRPKLVQFFDNHALSDGGVDDAVLHKPFIYGATFPAPADMDRQISAFLREENGGRDRFDEIGDVIDKALEGDRAEVLCQLDDVPNLIYITTGGESNSPPILCGDRTGDDFLVNGLSTSVMYVLADIISTDSFTVAVEDPRVTGLITDVRGMMGVLKTYIADDAHQVTRTTRVYKSFKAFYTAQYSSIPTLDSGEIEGMMHYCQSDGMGAGLTTAQVGGTAQSYILAVKNCYNTYVTNPRSRMSERGKEFVTKIMLPATEAYSNRVATFSPGGQSKAKDFMQSRDYVQLGQGYDPLASRRSEYPMSDYLSETINDGYTDSVSWVRDESGNNEVSVSSSAPVGYISDFDNSVEPSVLWHLFLINNELVKNENYTIFLDRPLAAAPASTTPSTTTTTTPAANASGNAEAQNRQVFLGEVHAVRRIQVESNRNMLQQMNQYISDSLTANKPVMLFAWFWMATESHDPAYQGAPEHFTGDLSLVTENLPATGTFAQYFSDPYLARITNACSPNLVFDRISKTDLPAWKKCLEYESEYVDKSDTNKIHKAHNVGVETNFTMTLGSGLLPLKMKRSQPVVTAMQSMIATIQSCIDRPTCLSLNDRDLGDQGTRESGNAPGTPDAGDSMLNAILSIINLILGLVIKFLLWLTALVMSFFQSVLSYAGFTTSDFVVKMWKAVRDFVNLFFILALLGIAVANIVQYEINNYAVKTILPKLIVVVIAVNFSRLIVGVGIDAGNVVEAGIYQIAGMGPHGGGTQAVCSTNTTQVGTLDVAIPQDIKDGSILCRLARGLRFQELQNYRANNSAPTSTLTSLFMINLAILLILIMMLFGFLALAVTFTIRIIVLWALAITSPIFVISKISPIGSGIASEWQGKFTKYAFMQIKVAFFLTLAVLASEAVGSQIFANLANTSPAVGDNGLSPVGFNSLADYLQLVFVIAMIYAAAFTSAKGDYGNSIVDGISKYGQNPFSTLRTGAGYVGKGIGVVATGSDALGGKSLMGLFGNRLQDKKGNSLFSKGVRGLGAVIASPANYNTARKNVLADLKSGAEDRQKRFGAISAHRIALGTEMKQKFQATVTENENKIVSEIAKDAGRRYNPESLRDQAQKAYAAKDFRHYRGYIQALVQQGAGDFDEVAGDGVAKIGADGKVVLDAKGKPVMRTLREQFMEAEMLRDPFKSKKSPEQAKMEANRELDQLEETNNRQGKSLFDQGKTFAAKTNDKVEIKAKLQEAINEGNKQFALGILTAAFEGRIADATGEAGSGIAFEMFQIMDESGKIRITGNDRRKLGKDIAKDGSAAIGVVLNTPEGQASHLEDLYKAAKELNLVDNSAEKYAQIGPGKAKDQIRHIMSVLGATGKYTEKIIQANGEVIDGLTKYISESATGLEAAKRVAANQLRFFNEVKLAGDDGTIGSSIQMLSASGTALSSGMTESGKFKADSKMVREAMMGFIQNAAVVGKSETGATVNEGAVNFNKKNYETYLETLGGTVTTQAQLTSLNQMLKSIEDLNESNKSLNQQQKLGVKAQLDQFKAQITAMAQNNISKAARPTGGDDTPPTT